MRSAGYMLYGEICWETEIGGWGGEDGLCYLWATSRLCDVSS